MRMNICIKGLHLLMGISVISGVKLQTGQTTYFDKHYDTKQRFISYWHQINEIITLKPTKLLEVGIGNGLVSDYIRKRGIDIITLDIDDMLNPDVVGNIICLPFDDNSFDMIACCEVLEHLPYDNFQKALAEIHRVTSKYAVISLPDVSHYFRMRFRVPRVVYIRRIISLPVNEKRPYQYDGIHYWEIGRAGYPLRKIVYEIERAGFQIHRSYRVFEHPYHRFIILEKAKEKR